MKEVQAAAAELVETACRAPIPLEAVQCRDAAAHRQFAEAQNIATTEVIKATGRLRGQGDRPWNRLWALQGWVTEQPVPGAPARTGISNSGAPTGTSPPAGQVGTAAGTGNTPERDGERNRLHSLPDDAWMNHVELAEHLDLDSEPLRSRFDRWRKKNPGSDGWCEVTDRRSRQPKYMYRVGTVRGVFQEALESSPATD
jgi:hypothetical protein